MQYCGETTQNQLCLFGYEKIELLQQRSLITRAIEYRRTQENLPKDFSLQSFPRRESQFHIDVERTQGGGAVSYLMKYALQAPSQQEVETMTQTERQRDHHPEFPPMVNFEVIYAFTIEQKAWAQMKQHGVFLNTGM